MLIIVRNASWAANQHIRIISEGSCDTEDCSNDAENSALVTNKLHFKHLQTAILNCKNISKYYCNYCILDQINVALVSRRVFFSKKNIKKISYTPNLMNNSVYTEENSEGKILLVI